MALLKINLFYKKKSYLQLTLIAVDFETDNPIPFSATTMYFPWSEHFIDGILKITLLEL